jgi:O-antigen ligase
MSIIYFLIALMPFDNHPFWGKEIVGTFTIVKALGLVCFLVALYHISTGNVSLHLLRTPQAYWYLAFLIVQCSSIFTQMGHLVNGGNSYSHVFSILALFISVPALLATTRQLNRGLLVGIGAIGFTSLYVIRGWQHYGGRPGGMFGDANEYALVVGMWIPLTFLWAFSKRPKWERLLCLGCLGADLLGTTLAASRGGFLGLGVAFLFLIFHSDHKIRNLFVVGALVVPLSLFAPSSPLRRFTDPNYGDQRAEVARLVAWKAGLRMIHEHPLTGNGLGNFKPLMTQYQDPGERVISLAHNTYVEVAAELGIPAVLIYLGTFISAIISLEASRRRARAAGLLHLSNVALGLQAGLVSYVFSAFFMSAWWQKLLWFVVFVTFCVDTQSRRRIRRKRVTRAHPNDAPDTPATLNTAFDALT